MNLFILSLIQREIAMFMMDKHVYKILLEAVQMLCCAKRLLEPDEENDTILYKISHKNHPVSIWCRTSRENFIWTLDLIEELHNEWRYRYNHSETKFHKSYIVAIYLRNNIPNKFPESGLTQFSLAMPDIYKNEDTVLSYRNYYMSVEKQKIASWKKREKPEWYIINNSSPISKLILDIGLTTPSEQLGKFFCSICNSYLTKNYKSKHIKTKKHLIRLLKQN